MKLTKKTQTQLKWILVIFTVYIILTELIYILFNIPPPFFDESDKISNYYDWLVISDYKGKDLTEGRYQGNYNLSREAAQDRQHKHLLNLLNLKKGDNVLEIGCGEGRFLKKISELGINITGLTLSQEQVNLIKKKHYKNVNIKLLNYKNIPESYYNKYDAILSNGSLEHFRGVSEKEETVYKNFFNICNKCLKKNGRVVITAIHRKGDLWKKHLLEAYLMSRTYGGSYPDIGFLDYCSQPHFKKVHEEDTTDDYITTGETNNDFAHFKPKFSLKLIPFIFTDRYLIHKYLHLNNNSWKKQWEYCKHLTLCYQKTK